MNGHDAGSCPSAANVSSGRFLHVAQAPTLRDDDNNDGWYWGDVRDALLATWPACNMNNGLYLATCASAEPF
jgi:hypothetical protein